MPSLADIRKQYPNLSKLTDYDVASLYAQEEGISPETAMYELGVRQEKSSGLMGDWWRETKGGAAQLPGAIAALGELPITAMSGARPFTRGYQALTEAMGVDPERYVRSLQQEQTPEYQQQRAELEALREDPEAGFLENVGGYLARPAQIGGLVASSLPGVGAGGLLARGARLAGLGARTSLAAGEGGIMGGTALAGYDPDLPNQERAALLSGVVGVGGGALGVGGAALARRAGLADIDAMIAGQPADLLQNLAKRPMSYAGRVGAGALTESAFEEMPQSALETVMGNLMRDQDPTKGLAANLAAGGLAGATMGGMMNLRGRSRADWQKDIDAAQAIASDEAQPFETRAKAFDFLQRVRENDITAEEAQAWRNQIATGMQADYTARLLSENSALDLLAPEAVEAERNQVIADAGFRQRQQVSPDTETALRIMDITGQTQQYAPGQGYAQWWEQQVSRPDARVGLEQIETDPAAAQERQMELLAQAAQQLPPTPAQPVTASASPEGARMTFAPAKAEQTVGAANAQRASLLRQAEQKELEAAAIEQTVAGGKSPKGRKLGAKTVAALQRDASRKLAEAQALRQQAAQITTTITPVEGAPRAVQVGSTETPAVGQGAQAGQGVGGQVPTQKAAAAKAVSKAKKKGKVNAPQAAEAPVPAVQAQAQQTAPLSAKGEINADGQVVSKGGEKAQAAQGAEVPAAKSAEAKGVQAAEEVITEEEVAAAMKEAEGLKASATTTPNEVRGKVTLPQQVLHAIARGIAALTEKSGTPRILKPKSSETDEEATSKFGDKVREIIGAARAVAKAYETYANAASQIPPSIYNKTTPQGKERTLKVSANAPQSTLAAKQELAKAVAEFRRLVGNDMDAEAIVAVFKARVLKVKTKDTDVAKHEQSTDYGLSRAWMMYKNGELAVGDDTFRNTPIRESLERTAKGEPQTLRRIAEEGYKRRAGTFHGNTTEYGVGALLSYLIRHGTGVERLLSNAMLRVWKAMPEKSRPSIKWVSDKAIPAFDPSANTVELSETATPEAIGHEVLHAMLHWFVTTHADHSAVKRLGQMLDKVLAIPRAKLPTGVHAVLTAIDAATNEAATPADALRDGVLELVSYAATHREFSRWLRSVALSEGVDVPTSSAAHNKELDKLAEKHGNKLDATERSLMKQLWLGIRSLLSSLLSFGKKDSFGKNVLDEAMRLLEAAEIAAPGMEGPTTGKRLKARVLVKGPGKVDEMFSVYSSPSEDMLRRMIARGENSARGFMDAKGIAYIFSTEDPIDHGMVAKELGFTQTEKYDWPYDKPYVSEKGEVYMPVYFQLDKEGNIQFYQLRDNIERDSRGGMSIVRRKPQFTAVTEGMFFGEAEYSPEWAANFVRREGAAKETDKEVGRVSAEDAETLRKFREAFRDRGLTAKVVKDELWVYSDGTRLTNFMLDPDGVPISSKGEVVSEAQDDTDLDFTKGNKLYAAVTSAQDLQALGTSQEADLTRMAQKKAWLQPLFESMGYARVPKWVEAKADALTKAMQQNWPAMAGYLSKWNAGFNVSREVKDIIQQGKATRGVPVNLANDFARFLGRMTPEQTMEAFAYLDGDTDGKGVEQHVKASADALRAAYDALRKQLPDAEVTTYLDGLKMSEALVYVLNADMVATNSFGAHRTKNLIGTQKLSTIVNEQIFSPEVDGIKDPNGRYRAVRVEEADGTVSYEMYREDLLHVRAPDSATRVLLPGTYKMTSHVDSKTSGQTEYTFSSNETLSERLKQPKGAEQISAALVNTIALMSNAVAATTTARHLALHGAEAGDVFDNKDALMDHLKREKLIAPDADIRLLEWGTSQDRSDTVQDMYRSPLEWVQVPNSDAYGALKGKVVRGATWMALQDSYNRANLIPFNSVNAAMRHFKKVKTVYNLPTHVTNVMTNFTMAYLHNLPAASVSKALRLWTTYQIAPHKVTGEDLKIVRAFLESGAELGDFSTNEVKQVLFDAIRDTLETNKRGPMASLMTYVNLQNNKVKYAKMAVEKGIAGAKTVDDVMTRLYASEDNAFRLAAFMTRLGDLQRQKTGGKDHADMVAEAGRYAKDAFLDYDIDSRAVLALRQTVLPFISWTYAITPVLAKIALHQPWKLVTLGLAYQTVMMMASAAAGGDDDDKERKLLGKDERMFGGGFGPYTEMRFPLMDSPGKKGYINIGKYIPIPINFREQPSGFAGMQQWPAALQPSGPLLALAYAGAGVDPYTGKKLAEKTDTNYEAALKSMQYLWQQMTPGGPIGAALPGTKQTFTPKAGSLGHPGDQVAHALKLFGAPVSAVDVAEAKKNRAAALERIERDFAEQQGKIKSQYKRGNMKADEYFREKKALEDKKKAAIAEKKGIE